MSDCTRINQIDLRPPLGTGFTGTVHPICEGNVCNQKVIKVSKRYPSYNELSKTYSAWTQEVRALAKLQKCGEPRIAPKVYDAWTCVNEVLPHGIPKNRVEVIEYVIMDRVVGQTLKEQRQFDTIALLPKVKQSVDRMHTCGVIHDDLHSENIMVTQDGNIVIIDFGFSTLVGEQNPQPYNQDTRSGLLRSFMYGFVPPSSVPAWDYLCLTFDLWLSLHVPLQTLYNVFWSNMTLPDYMYSYAPFLPDAVTTLLEFIFKQQHPNRSIQSVFPIMRRAGPVDMSPPERLTVEKAIEEAKRYQNTEIPSLPFNTVLPSADTLQYSPKPTTLLKRRRAIRRRKSKTRRRTSKKRHSAFKKKSYKRKRISKRH